MSDEPESRAAEKGSEVCSLTDAIGRVAGNARRNAVVFASLLTFTTPATATSELAPHGKPKDPPVQTPSENSVKAKGPTDKLEVRRDLDSQLALMRFRTGAEYATELRSVLGESLEEMAPYMGAIQGSSTMIGMRSWLEALGLRGSTPRKLRVERLLKRNQTIESIVTMGREMSIDLPAQNQSYARALANAINLDVSFRMLIERMKRNDSDTPGVPGAASKYAERIYEAYREAYKEKGEARSDKLRQIENMFLPERIWSAVTEGASLEP